MANNNVIRAIGVAQACCDEVLAVKAAWAYCDEVSKNQIVCQARREDMSFKGYIAMDIRENHSQEIPEDIREQVIGFILEHYNL